MSGIVSVLDPLYLDRFERRQLAPVEAVATPFGIWNRHCRDDGGGKGIARGWSITVGGNPGHGKSLLALNLAAHAMRAGEKVGFVSLEMAPEQLSARLYAILTGTPVEAVEKGSFSSGSFARLRAQLMAMLATAGDGTALPDFLVNEDPLVGVPSVLAAMDVMREEGCGFLVVDYLQLVGGGDEESLYRQVSEVANAMRTFARQHRVTVVGLSQYNRRTSADYTQSPRAQSLHGGMPLEASSDQVVLLDHSRFERDALHPHLARTWLLLDKNRHGGTGAIPLEWDHRTLQVREGRDDEEHEWPKHGSGGR